VLGPITPWHSSRARTVGQLDSLSDPLADETLRHPSGVLATRLVTNGQNEKAARRARQGVQLSCKAAFDQQMLQQGQTRELAGVREVIYAAHEKKGKKLKAPCRISTARKQGEQVVLC